MARIVVIGAGVGGLGTALCAARTGHSVTVVERDDTPLPADPHGAFEWDRRGAPQVRHSHAFLARLRNQLRDRHPDVLAALLAAGATEMRFTEMAPEGMDITPEPGDEDLVGIAVRRTTFEWVLRRLASAEGDVELVHGTAAEALRTVRDPLGPGTPRVIGVELADGSTVDADLVVVGIGVIPNTGWLESSGLALDNGVLCDETTLVAPGIDAAGDIARWPNGRFGETMRVEHWEHALDMAMHAAKRLLAWADGDADPDAFRYEPVPWFWSDQYDRKLQLAGRPSADDELVVVAGALDEERFCVAYGRDGKATAVLAVNMAARVVRYRRALAEGLPWEKVLEDAAASEAGASR